ncbi:DUF58 domain-containing protein [Leptospira sp. 2 VSF19]|uniref:DUF58 domain-containing protein n=1 Tax=Leptospira soteropolitanensis TaxID=2950025 RepID=A0AAW5VJQ7_9LEPT|nr:DUF58 domain-containing protein [Leptospira soteropolitanensis]MCW7492717.1 DUF58 domain-containing protein [Leptospira soteropolitanensis]MCW7500400.1 DUF58 domain-containing protein [Leptospira soteropolitanensis]MCW7522565.1 DUF58 domain-containing protein [Leptospira soteropolitanensis]MCW7526421.1 DUF58 domain-containing protein [Leptospira soteropolitanensis]MCW7530370.1 DUF58 domain-containing protein [Leptospira soteropolitanensis]
MLSPELKRLLQVLQWETKKRFSSTRQGIITMSEKGRGLDFKEVRNYHLGDDIRYIDWNVTSRTGELYTKEFYEERDAPIIIFLDLSNSLSGSKKESAFQMALFLSLFHVKIGNRVLLISFSSNQKSSANWLRTESEVFLIFTKVTKQTGGDETNYEEAYQYAFKLYPKFAVSYWISDFNQFSAYLKNNKVPKIWEQAGIWIEDELEIIQYPTWFKFFGKISEEKISFCSLENTYEKDLKAAKTFFGQNLVRINPKAKLSNQILPLFKAKRNG